jgi:two-component system NtrC family sensor kinase
MLETTLDIIRYGLNFAMMSGHQKDVQNVIDELSQKESIYRIRIFDKNGIVKFSSNREEINTEISMISPHHSDYEQTETKIVRVDTGDEIYSSIEPILNRKPCQSCHEEDNLIAYLDLDTHLTRAENKFYTGSIHMIILGWVVILILLIGLYLIFNKFINSPLQKLVIALADVKRGNLNVRLEDIRKDEMGTVYQHFNAMTSNLKSSREKIDQMHMEELQRLNRLKTLGELTSQTAHEVNNHIAIIMARADFLSLESKNNPDLKKYYEDFDVLQDQLSKISTITGNILKYSRKDSTEKKEVDLINIVNESVAVYKPVLEKNNIKLKTEISIGSATTIADSVQVNQILSNLITNAADAIARDGEISISLAKNTDNKIALAVRDTGSGIKEEMVNEIFSPFFTTKTSKNNTGLGLYIVKKICENHNAKIICESDSNTGTIFTITFN